MCMGGGNTAAQQAEQQAQEQQQTETSNINAINGAFSNRQSQYNDYLAALRQSYGTQLQTQYAQAGRQNRFALARGGLTGGSEAAQLGGVLQQEEGQGSIEAEQQAQSKLAGLESSDQAERLQLISEAASGANIGNAAQLTSEALQTNIQNAQEGLSPNSLGDMFGQLSATTNSMNAAGAQRLGLRAAQAYTNPFSNTSTTSSGYGAAGSGV